MFDDREIKLNAFKNPAWDGLELYFTAIDHVKSKMFFATGIDFDKEVEPYELRTGPTARLSYHQAIALMDSMWDAGFRPSSGEGNAGQLGATEKHLSDMRTLVKHHTGADL